MKISDDARHEMQLNALRTTIKLKSEENWRLQEIILALKEKPPSKFLREGILIPPMLLLELTKERKAREK